MGGERWGTGGWGGGWRCGMGRVSKVIVVVLVALLAALGGAWAVSLVRTAGWVRVRQAWVLVEDSGMQELHEETAGGGWPAGGSNSSTPARSTPWCRSGRWPRARRGDPRTGSGRTPRRGTRRGGRGVRGGWGAGGVGGGRSGWRCSWSRRPWGWHSPWPRGIVGVAGREAASRAGMPGAGWARRRPAPSAAGPRRRGRGVGGVGARPRA